MDKIIGAVTGRQPSLTHGLTSEQVNLLTQAFDPLEKAGAGLSGKALTFVCEGAQETVLLDLHAAQPFSPSQLLGEPGRMYGKFWGHGGTKSQAALGKKSLAGRARFYDTISAATPPLDVLVRLGKLFVAAHAGKPLESSDSLLPDWLLYLVNDAVFASFDSSSEQDLSKKRPAWTVDLIGQLLVHDGADDALALQLLFGWESGSSYGSTHGVAALIARADVAAYMVARRDAVQALPSRLSAAGRVLLAQRIGRDKPLLNEFAALFVQLASDDTKSVRAEAVLHLEGIAQPRRLELLAQLLEGGTSARRIQAAELLARLLGDSARTLLCAALERETSKPVQQAIRTALMRLDAAGDAGTVELPEPPPWQAFVDTRLGDDALELLIANRIELTQRAHKSAQEEIEDNKTSKNSYKWRQDEHARISRVSDDDMRAVVRVLNGEGSKSDRQRIRSREVANPVDWGNKLQALPSFSATHLVRWLAASRSWGSFWDDERFQTWLSRQALGSVDLRALADLLQRSGASIDKVACASLCTSWSTPSAVEALPADCVWPFFAEHPAYIDEGLGLVARVPNKENNRNSFELGPTLQTLGAFPVVLPRWLPRVMELALGDGKTHRAAAQAALSKLPDIGKRVVESLAHSKSEVRIEAAHWLAELNYTAAVAPLTTALDKESRETVRAAFLTALEALGDDISGRLTPEILAAEARKGLKAKAPAGLAWFAFDALPMCKWASGKPVTPEIVQWWVVLACKLKEPAGNALLTRYLGLLDAASRQALGASVLHQFIAQDTRSPSLEEGIAHAKSIAPGIWQNYQDRYNRASAKHKEYYEVDYQRTPEQVFEQCKREKMSEYLGSAIGEKGVLALTAYAPGHEIVTRMQHYMRDHFQRRSQVEAMLDGVATGNDPVVIQLLLGVSRRYRTASVQSKARALVQEIADRNGWSQDQLADRTIPTAGLDDTGSLALHYGERVFSVVLDADMKPELRNPEGKAVKTLPEPRQNDDPVLVKEAKAAFSTSKRELKQVIELQTARLFEAMCSGRVWPQGEWRDYLHRHPIAGRLIQRLVWLEVDPDGVVRGSLRPTEDGSFIDTQDDTVELASDSRLRLAHASLVEGDVSAAWIGHFRDYKLAPLFPQMSRKTPVIAFTDAAGAAVTEITDRQGWISDTFTLRGSFAKLGYQRAHAEDGGFFYQYTKEFAGVGVRVAIDFSGSTLPEENVAAALKSLSFEDMKSRRWNEHALPLAQVAPVLLAEAYADYLAVAGACAGFDPDWEKKMPW